MLGFMISWGKWGPVRKILRRRLLLLGCDEKILNSFPRSLNTYLLSTYCLPCTALGTWKIRLLYRNHGGGSELALEMEARHRQGLWKWGSLFGQVRYLHISGEGWSGIWRSQAQGRLTF